MCSRGMDTHNRRTVVVIVLLIVLGGALWYLSGLPQHNPITPQCDNTDDTFRLRLGMYLFTEQPPSTAKIRFWNPNRTLMYKAHFTINDTTDPYHPYRVDTMQGNTLPPENITVQVSHHRPPLSLIGLGTQQLNLTITTTTPQLRHDRIVAYDADFMRQRLRPLGCEFFQ